MHELRLVAVSEDGSYAVLVVPGRSGRFALPIDERLRTVARGQFSRLAQYEIEVESPLRPKEIQDRIRAGETAEDIADAAGLPVDLIRRFEGPVLAEREFRAKEAQRATVRGHQGAGPGPRLGDIVAQRLTELGAAPDDVEWDSRKRPDGNWQVQIAYTVAGRLQLAEWVFDPRSKHVTADDDQAARLSLPEADWPAAGPGGRGAATATVTPIGSWAAAGGQHQGEQRQDADRHGGRGTAHPSRQAAGVALAPAGAGRANAPSSRADAAAEAVVGRAGQAPVKAPPAAAREVRAGREAPTAREAPAAARGRTAGRDLPADRQGAGADGRQGAGGASTEPEAGQQPGAAAPAAAAEQQAAAAPASPRRAPGGRSRRSSVPSWDEIMFGNSRQSD